MMSVHRFAASCMLPLAIALIPLRRHSALGYESPVNFENKHERAGENAWALQRAGLTTTVAGSGSPLLPSAPGAASAFHSSGGWEQIQHTSVHLSTISG
jgi:hypothetical protein